VIGYKISSAWVLVTFVAKSGFMKPKWLRQMTM
jgi:hypothetical protein